VPAEAITGTEPGELFVHRNLANMVVHTDFNMFAVLQYAVEALKVKHVIMCGRYNRGGVQNAMKSQDFGFINKRLQRLKDVCRIYQDQIGSLADTQAGWDRLVDINVKEQVQNLTKTPIIQQVRRQEQRPTLHGWVYDLRTLFELKLKEVAEIR
jgi:carbonic anhydrase